MRLFSEAEQEACQNLGNIPGAAKGGRQKEFDHFFVFGTRSVFLVTFSDASVTFSVTFCQTPFAGVLLRQGDNCQGSRGSSKKSPIYRTWPDLRYTLRTGNIT